MAKTSISPPKAADLLAWYKAKGRDLPWRSHNGKAASPYHTWLSEVMLQQTTVVTVIPYYERFTSKWPTVQDLAAAHEDDVLKEWAGLGYYSRARNLLKCARLVTEQHNGIFPTEIDALKALPGIGDYTANAIRAIAYDLPANVVDGNVERVTSRVFAFDKPINIPANKQHLKTLAATLAPQKNAGAYAQAIMDLGATICTPRNPKCDLCPWQDNCQAFATGQAEALPIIERRAKNPQRSTSAFVMYDKAGHFFLRQRPSSGLLGGLWEFPSSDWTKEGETVDPILPPLTIDQFYKAHKPVNHVFTHFKLVVTVYASKTPVMRNRINEAGTWFKPDEFPALSTLTRKILEAAYKIGVN